MTAKLKPYCQQWENAVDEYLARFGLKRLQIITPIEAWNIASIVGVIKDAYALPANLNVTDAHIQTALKRIFPNVVFKKSAISTDTNANANEKRKL